MTLVGFERVGSKKNSPIQQEILRRERVIGKAVYSINVVEQSAGTEKLITILERRKLKIHITTSSSLEDIESEQYPYDVKSIERISSKSFVIHENNSNNIRLLTVDYQGNSQFQDEVIFRETTHKIVKMLADSGKLYILCASGPEHFFKVFHLKASNELAACGVISNIEATNSEFIQEFKNSQSINGNVLIVNDQKFYKIYDDENATIDPSIQPYYNFLPKADADKDDRCMTTSLLRNCPMHERLMMQFNYPESCSPKEVLVVPYIA